MTRQYTKPPVSEAVCEFKFASSQPWDLLVPARLAELIRDEFPINEPVNAIQVTQDASGQQNVQMQSAIRFLSVDRTEAIQMGANTLSVHQIGQYKNWEHFKSRIQSALAAYTQVANFESLARVGLRYINRVELPGKIPELDDYFRVMPHVPDPIPQVFQSFLAQVQIPYGQLPDKAVPESWLRMTFGTVVPQTPDTLAVVLDLDMFTPDNAVPSVDAIDTWIESAHTRIEEAFDAAFTEKTHQEVFGEVTL